MFYIGLTLCDVSILTLAQGGLGFQWGKSQQLWNECRDWLAGSILYVGLEPELPGKNLVQ